MRVAMTHDQLTGTFGADAVVRVSDAGVAHEPTRRWLAEVGVPREAAGVRLDLERGLRTAGEHVAPRTLPEWVAELLVLGTAVEDYDTVLLDGATGRVFHGWLNYPDDLCLLASDLSSLVRLATAVTQLPADGGEFARFAGRRGPAVVTELTELLLGLIREHDPELLEPSRRISAHWRVAAYLLPLARIAGPGDGLALDLPAGLLAEAFGTEDLHRYDDAELPAVLTYQPTRRFLRDHGLPETNTLSLASDEPVQTLADYYRDDPYYRNDAESALPGSAGNLVRLGYLVDDIDLVVEGATGRVLGWYVPDQVLRPVNLDVSTLAFAQWLVRQEQLLEPVHRLTGSESALISTMTQVLASVDPIACQPTGAEDDHRYWPELFDDGHAGILYA